MSGRGIGISLSLALTFLGSTTARSVEPVVEADLAPFPILESYPPEMAKSLMKYERQVSAAGFGIAAGPKYLLVPKHRLWRPGQTITVAFSGGSPELHALIERAATSWTQPGAANLTLKFRGPDNQFIRWSSKDKEYRGMIRISFDAKGYWSMVGSDSIASNVRGGGANEASMNLQGFDNRLPFDWEAVVRHEFGHALGFEHEHQMSEAACDFRFDDDPGYLYRTDSKGYVVPDAEGRRPGLYNVLGGAQNYWSPPEVDRNLRALPISSAYLVSTFDKASIMKYFFYADMFISGAQSGCYTDTKNLELSPLDMAGAQRAYPYQANAIALIVEERGGMLKALSNTPGLFSGSVRESATRRLDATGF